MDQQTETRSLRPYALGAGLLGVGLGATALAAVFGARGSAPAPVAVRQAVAASAVPKPTPRVVASTETENIASLRVLNDSFKSLAKFAGPAVVHIKAESGRSVQPDGTRSPRSGGEGSGFIFRPDGYIITNDHVAGGYDKVTVVLADGREFPGKVTRAYDSDLAIVKIEANDLPTLALADSNEVAAGEFAMAIGAPFGLENTVSVGHVSALHRADTPIGDRLYPDLIQTDTAINMGNSGGPLINVDGKVIGVNTAIFSPTGTSAGIGFAIPSSQVRVIAELLVSKGKLERSYMGVRPVALKGYQKSELGLPGGALLASVESDGPAAAAGLREGDIVTKIAGTPIVGAVDLRNQMLINPAGRKVRVEYVRDKKVGTADVELKALPPEAAARMAPPASRTPRMEMMPEDGRIPREFRDFFQDMPRRGRPAPPQGEAPVPPMSEGPRLGATVTTLDETARRQFSVPATAKGVLVAEVAPGSAAQTLGLQVGDVIVSVDGKPVETADALVAAIRAHKRGDTIRVKSTRYGQGSVATLEGTATLR